MRGKLGFLVSGWVVLVAMTIANAALADTVTRNGISLTTPSYPIYGPAYISCEPWMDPAVDQIMISGVPDGSTVRVVFFWSSPLGGGLNFLAPLVFQGVDGNLVVPVMYPQDTTQWPMVDEMTNERAIIAGVFVEVVGPDGMVTKIPGKQWWIRCLPPPPPAEGCTPGYWRQSQHFDAWDATGYSIGDDFGDVFGVGDLPTFDPSTLLDAVWLGGGGEYALARHAVAALLNASHPDLDYFFSEMDIIAGVQGAYATGNFEPFKDALDAANNAGCSLN